MLGCSFFLSLCSTVGHLITPMSLGGGEGQVRKARRHLCCVWFLGSLTEAFSDCSVTSDIFFYLLPDDDDVLGLSY